MRGTARRTSNTAIDFTHVATNNHAPPIRIVGTIAITNIKNTVLERPQMHHTRHRDGAQLLSAHRIPRANRAALDVPPISN